MIECVIAWITLVAYVVEGEPYFLIASGLFAIATNVYTMHKDKK